MYIFVAFSDLMNVKHDVMLFYFWHVSYAVLWNSVCKIFMNFK